MMKYAPLAILIVPVLLYTHAQQRQGAKGEVRQWSNVEGHSDFAAPAKWNPALPLSDQANAGKWSPIAALTDEFDGTSLDGTKWFDHNPEYDGKKPGYYDPASISIKDGILNIGMSKKTPSPELNINPNGREYAGGTVRSKVTTTYGYYEIRAKIMKSRADSAFWFSNKDATPRTEIDVFEDCGTDPKWNTKTSMTGHVFLQGTAEGDRLRYKGVGKINKNLSDDFHVYGFDWEADSLKFYVDGQLVCSGENTDWKGPLYMILSTGILEGWYGLPEDSELPNSFQVDYIRSWTKGA